MNNCFKINLDTSCVTPRDSTPLRFKQTTKRLHLGLTLNQNNLIFIIAITTWSVTLDLQRSAARSIAYSNIYCLL